MKPLAGLKLAIDQAVPELVEFHCLSLLSAGIKAYPQLLKRPLI